jgi:hypothetical protein
MSDESEWLVPVKTATGPGIVRSRATPGGVAFGMPQGREAGGRHEAGYRLRNFSYGGALGGHRGRLGLLRSEEAELWQELTANPAWTAPPNWRH